MIIETRTGDLALLLSTNDTTAGTSIADPGDTLTNPLGSAGYISAGYGGGVAPSWLKIIPLGVGNADTTMLMSIFAVEKIPAHGAAGVKDAWTHHLLGAWTCTLSAKTGVSGGLVGTGTKYIDTLSLTSGSANEGVGVDTVSPTNDQAAHVMVTVKAGLLVCVKFALNASATSCNALWKLV